MNSIHKKILLIICFSVLLPACGWGGGSSDNNEKQNIELCDKAKNGSLNINAIDLKSVKHNSFLFACAVHVRIGEADETRQKYLEIQNGKMQVADTLFVGGLDASYVNQDGDTLLMLVVTSFLPDDWKLKSAKLLISKGVDKNHKNTNGDTALELAKFKKNTQLIELLSTD